MEDKREFLEKHLNFWNELSAQEKDFCVDNTNIVSYKKGQMIKSAEKECLGILIVKSGEVRTYLLSEYGKEVHCLEFLVVRYVCFPHHVCLKILPLML